MPVYKIVGESKPNRVKLQAPFTKELMELPKTRARQMLEWGLIEIQNPELLYVRI